MTIDTQRSQFANFIKENNLGILLKLEYSTTVDQQSTLKYERVDHYSVAVLSSDEMTKLIRFCIQRNISLWIGADKLCIGYNYKGNMRLSAYSKDVGCRDD